MKVIIDDGAFMPTRAHEDDAGLDLYSPVNTFVPGRGSVIINTGVRVEIPDGCAGFLESKSGLNVKHGITSFGVIDKGYTGAIIAELYNHSDEDYTIRRGDKITQLVVIPIYFPDLEIVDEFEETDRGEDGFGSTGR